MKTATERLQEFAAVLEVAALQSHRADEREALEHGRRMALALIARGEVNGPNADSLARFVDDSLPWTEDILQAWHLVHPTTFTACPASIISAFKYVPSLKQSSIVMSRVL